MVKQLQLEIKSRYIEMYGLNDKTNTFDKVKFITGKTKWKYWNYK